MKSRFPGMDPYLEAHWSEVHPALIVYSMDRLQHQLPRGLRARMAVRFIDATDDTDELQANAAQDQVAERAYSRKRRGRAVACAVRAPEPILLQIAGMEMMRQSFIEIVDSATGNRVITVIEFLSPTNKVPGDGRDQYLKKQRDLKASQTNLVEIDLTRRGQRRLVIPISRIPRRYRTTFQVCVRRAAKPASVELYPISLPTPLPKIAVPLRKKDADVSLDLQSLIEQCYKNGRYDDIDYTVPPNPPLSSDDAKWAASWLKKQRRT